MEFKNRLIIYHYIQKYSTITGVVNVIVKVNQDSLDIVGDDEVMVTYNILKYAIGIHKMLFHIQ